MGVGWQAQLVSYPFFRTVPAEHFASYHLQYNAAIPAVVIIPGFVTFLACMAFWWTRPREIGRSAAAIVVGSGVASLLATVLWAIPMHDRLDQIGQSAETIDSPAERQPPPQPRSHRRHGDPRVGLRPDDSPDRGWPRHRQTDRR